MIANGIRQLRDVQATILGSVLNDTDSGKDSSYYYQYQDYYAEDGGKKKKKRTKNVRT